MNPIANDILKHYGTQFYSGRYPYGSGKNPFQSSGDFLSRIEELKNKNFTFTDDEGNLWRGDTAIAKSIGLTSTEFQTQKSLALYERRLSLHKKAKDLREKGYSLNAIADRMGYKNDSSVRSLLDEGSAAKMNQAMKTADFLRKQVDKKGMIDVGKGVERELNISKEKMRQALYILKMEGYEQYGGGVPTGPNKQTNIQVLCRPGTEHKEIFDFEKVKTITDYKSQDGGDSFEKSWVYPKSMDSDRIQIRYAEEGGKQKDGLVELRRNVEDLSLGDSLYSQVRILVDDNKYIKGMAVYSDSLPAGVDLIFNTNKKKGTPKGDVLKDIENDPDNPFGSLIKDGIHDPKDPTSSSKTGQRYYYDEKGNKQLSLINKRADEGDWNDWSDSLASQFLSKQSQDLIDRQLKLSTADKQAEFDKLKSLVNPTVKKVLLQSFSDDCDAASVHLKAAALPRQKYQVILPITTLKDNETYAPNYNNGEKVALIRYPHGGTFEIPILTVNNKHLDSKKILGNTPKDAIGINSNVAERLSGADFDGDTVQVIPLGKKVKITSTPPLRGLEGFDNRMEYGYDEVKTNPKGEQRYYRDGREFRVMKNTQTEMGVISNLITDMTLKGAKQEELAKAVKHSMVVIDAEKHKLDYKKSEVDNDIKALKRKYQGRVDADGKYREGSSTLISQAKGRATINKRTGSPKVNIKGSKNYDPDRPEGALLWKSEPQSYIDKKGKTKYRTQRSTRMAETDDAYTLVSEANTPQERAYASYANKMKALANDARKEMMSTGKIEYNRTAKNTYQDEVLSLETQLNIALKNAPRERQARMMATSVVNAKRKTYPDMTKSEIKKAKQQALTAARIEVGAKRKLIEINDREWEAIQAGAISETRLKQILNNTDIDKIKERATPRKTNTLSGAQINRIKAMVASGYSTAQIARAMGVSSSTVSNHIK